MNSEIRLPLPPRVLALQTCTTTAWHDVHFHYANALSIGVFPSSDIFFMFFLQGLEDFVIQLFYLLGYSYNTIFHIIHSYCVCVFSLISFSEIYLEGYWILWDNFVSRHFAEGMISRRSSPVKFMGSLMYTIHIMHKKQYFDFFLSSFNLLDVLLFYYCSS